LQRLESLSPTLDASQGLLEAPQRDGFAEKIHNIRVKSRHGARRARTNHDGEDGLLRTDEADQLKAIHILQIHINQYHVGLLGSEDVQPFGTRIDLCYQFDRADRLAQANKDRAREGLGIDYHYF
jgi:hypothetical protein